MSHFSDARDVIAGGVNSPVRAFAGVGGDPVFFKSADGAWIESEDGRRYIDYVGSWGPMILGHGHPAVIEAVVATAQDGQFRCALCTRDTNCQENLRARTIDRTSAHGQFRHGGDHERNSPGTWPYRA